MMKFTPTLVLAVVASVGALQAQEITKPLGKWERKIGKNHITLIVEDNRLHMISAGESMATLHADYSITRDGVVYGVVTSIECDDDDNGDSTKEMFDAPFSFRFRIDEGALIIHDAKGRDTGKDEFYNGRFKAVQTVSARVEVVPTSPRLPNTTPPHVGVPSISSSKLPLPPCPIGSSFAAPSGDQMNSFFFGYMR